MYEGNQWITRNEVTFRNIQPGVVYAISICTIINGKSISERVVIPQRNLEEEIIQGSG